MIWTLLWKDTVQHARALTALALSALILPLVFALLAGPSGSRSAHAGFVLGYLAVSAPILLSQWFIGQEKIKGTFRILRMLPVPGAAVILTKCLGAALHCLILLNINLILGPALCRSWATPIPQPSWALVVWANALALFSLGISMVLFTALDTRIAIQSSIWALCGLMLVGYGAKNYLGSQSFEAAAGRAAGFASDFGILPLAALPALASLLLFGWSAWIFERKEWQDLEEN